MRNRLLVWIGMLFIVADAAYCSPEPMTIERVSKFENINYPQIAYWFFSSELLKNDKYLSDLDSLAGQGKQDMFFLTARQGLNFYDYEKIYPVLEKLVSQAHQRNIKIGLQLWENRGKPIAIEDTERCVTEGEIVLDGFGAGQYTAKARHVRKTATLTKSELLKVYAFRKVADGFYDLASLEDITLQCTARSSGKDTVAVQINAGPEMKGRTAYILTQHYYNYLSNHSPQAASQFVEALTRYSDIPLDGIALDEYTNMRISPPWELEKDAESKVFRERYYSIPMADAYKKQTGQSLDKAMLDMRYAPAGNASVRIRAINCYMDLMRQGPLKVEKMVYQKAKELYGQKTFIGVHDTHHNSLVNDEIWASGLNWWNIPRDYGHTDENTPLPTQMGIAMAYSGNILYNMFYSKNLDTIVSKALNDLRYGIRTDYHAINDIQNWGVSIEKPEAMARINPVESCVRLLNRFNPSLPDVKLLVVFGMEALANWYPDESARNAYDINGSLGIEEKAVELWNAGYLSALVPSDLIADGRLRLDENFKPILNGHRFDAIIYLYPQYAKEPVIKFLEQYARHGGRVMMEGTATCDFDGQDISDRFKTLYTLVTVKKFAVDQIPQLGISKNRIPDGCKNEDGSYVFTDQKSLETDVAAEFSIRVDEDMYTGVYKGLAAVQIDGKAGLKKLAAAGFKELRKNGKVILDFEKPTDVFIDSLRMMIETNAGMPRHFTSDTK
jgi:hypothetical protein